MLKRLLCRLLGCKRVVLFGRPIMRLWCTRCRKSRWCTCWVCVDAYSTLRCCDGTVYVPTAGEPYRCSSCRYSVHEHTL